MNTTRRLVLGLLLTLGLTGCATTQDGDGVATAGGAETTSSVADQGNAQDQALKFAQCMREQGIDMPDPQPGNAMPMSEGTSSKEELDAAMAKCKQFMPNGGDRAEDDPQVVAQKRELAQCMRDNGITNYPDPGEDGAVILDEESGIDPKSAEFQAAEKACEKYAVQPPGMSGAPTAGGN